MAIGVFAAATLRSLGVLAAAMLLVLAAAPAAADRPDRFMLDDSPIPAPAPTAPPEVDGTSPVPAPIQAPPPSPPILGSPPTLHIPTPGPASPSLPGGVPSPAHASPKPASPKPGTGILDTSVATPSPAPTAASPSPALAASPSPTPGTPSPVPASPTPSSPAPSGQRPSILEISPAPSGASPAPDSTPGILVVSPAPSSPSVPLSPGILDIGPTPAAPSPTPAASSSPAPAAPSPAPAASSSPEVPPVAASPSPAPASSPPASPAPSGGGVVVAQETQIITVTGSFNDSSNVQFVCACAARANTEYVGQVLSSAPAANPSACCAECQRANQGSGDGCGGWTFTPVLLPGGSGGTCTLLKTGGGWSLASKPSSTAGVVQRVEVVMPPGGQTINNIVTYQTVYNNASNSFVTYQLQWWVGNCSPCNGKCVLPLITPPPPAPTPVRISGTYSPGSCAQYNVQCVGWENTDYLGGDLKQATVSDPGACCAECQKVNAEVLAAGRPVANGCGGWTFVPGSVDPKAPNVCYMKRAGGGWTVRAAQGVTSGTVQGVEMKARGARRSDRLRSARLLLEAALRCSMRLGVLDGCSKPPPVVSTVQTIYNSVTNNFVTYQLAWWVVGNCVPCPGGTCVVPPQPTTPVQPPPCTTCVAPPATCVCPDCCVAAINNVAQSAAAQAAALADGVKAVNGTSAATAARLEELVKAVSQKLSEVFGRLDALQKQVDDLKAKAG
eukprot:scaffold13.g381.t1